MGGSVPSARTNRDVSALVVGLAVLALGMVAVRHGRVSGVEESVVPRASTTCPDGCTASAWPLQQLGALVLGPIVAIVALVLRRTRLAIAALAGDGAQAGSRAGGQGARQPAAARHVDRCRTSSCAATSTLAGESFVSGHAVLVAALAGVVTPYLPGRWKLVPWALVGRGHGRAGLRRRPQPARRRVRRGARRRHRRRRQPGASASRRPVARRRSTADVETGAAVAAADRHDAPGAAAVLVGVLGVARAWRPLPVRCGIGRLGASTARPTTPITVGSFDFAESVALAEVYSQALEAAGFTVRAGVRARPA